MDQWCLLLCLFCHTVLFFVVVVVDHVFIFSLLFVIRIAIFMCFWYICEINCRNRFRTHRPHPVSLRVYLGNKTSKISQRYFLNINEIFHILYLLYCVGEMICGPYKFYRSQYFVLIIAFIVLGFISFTVI